VFINFLAKVSSKWYLASQVNDKSVTTGEMGNQNVLWLGHLLLCSDFVQRTALHPKSEYNNFKEARFLLFSGFFSF